MTKKSPPQKHKGIDLLHPHPLHVTVMLGVSAVMLFVTLLVVDQSQKTQNQSSRADTALVNSSRINLTQWKLQLPVGTTGNIMEIKQPQLTTFQMSPWYVVSPTGNSIRFRAPVNAPTTSGSSYPRSELREMSNGGTTNASWSSSRGTHTLFLDEQIMQVPEKKKHVVAGQIHDGTNDVMVIRLEYPRLYVNVDGRNVAMLNANYTLGERFTVQFEVKGNKIKVYYNGRSTPSYTLNKTFSTGFFKVGAYTQSNCQTETNCTSSNYGEVVVQKALVVHN